MLAANEVTLPLNFIEEKIGALPAAEPLKTPNPLILTLPLIVTLSKFEQSSNTVLPMVVRFALITSSFIHLILLNALVPICVHPVPITTLNLSVGVPPAAGSPNAVKSITALPLPREADE